MRCRRRPTLPRSLERSTIGAVRLNDRVRDGNGCGPDALVASEDQSCHTLRPPWSQGRRACACDARGVRRSDKVIRRGFGSARTLVHRSALIVHIVRGDSTPYGGVVKPHGRLGALRSERIAPRPRAPYRRSGLLRPFRRLKASGSVHLGDGFPLRCFQRLSVPIIATRRCSWRHSRDTSGSSDPVLSY